MISRMVREKKQLESWDTYLFPYGVPLLVGGMLGVLLAFLIVKQSWLPALVVVCVVPAAIVLNRHPLMAVMIWFMLMPFLPFETVGPRVFWVVHRALIPLALGMAILARLLKVKEYKPMQLGRAEVSMAIYLLLGVVSVILTRQAPLPYLYELYDRMFVPFAAYWLVRILRLGEQDMKRLIPPMLVVCVAEIALGFWARYAPQSLPMLWSIERWGKRMSGSFNNPMIYGCTLACAIVFLFHYTVNCTKGIAQEFLIAIFVVGWVCILLTFTRSCWLGGILVLLGLLWLYPKHMLPLIVIAALGMGTLSASVLSSEFAFAVERMTTEDTIDSRIVLAHAGERMFYAKPLLGWGFGNYDRYDWRFMERVGGATPTDWDINKGTSHNTYLTILAEMGIVGFIFQLIPLVWWLGLTIKVLPRLPKRGFWSWRLLIAMWLSNGFYLVVSQFVDMRFFWFSIGLWWLTLGLIGNLVQTHLKPGDIGMPRWIMRSVGNGLYR
jgi:O-antigen ligase